MKYPTKRMLATAAAALIATSPAKSEDQTEVQKKTAELQQQTALLNAQTALLQAKWPVVEGGKEGKLSKESGSVYALGAWEQVYQRLGQAADEICAAVKATPSLPTPVALLTEGDVESAQRYRLVATEQAAILAAVDQLAKPTAPPVAPAMAGAAALAAVVPSLLSITKLFRTDIALHDETVSIANATLSELVYLCLRLAPSVGVAYPAVPGLSALAGAKTTKLGKGIEAMLGARSRLQQVVDDKSDAARSAAAAALIERIDKFVTELHQAPAAGGRAPVAEALLGEAVDDAVKKSGGLLLVSIVQQGGNSMITSSVWHEDRLYVAGGAIVSYKLIEQDRLLAAGTIRKVDLAFQQVPLQR